MSVTPACPVCDELLIAYTAGLSVHETAALVGMDAQRVLDHPRGHGLSLWRHQGPTRCTCGAWVPQSHPRCLTCGDAMR